jgi:hypothetical protein
MIQGVFGLFIASLSGSMHFHPAGPRALPGQVIKFRLIFKRVDSASLAEFEQNQSA